MSHPDITPSIDGLITPISALLWPRDVAACYPNLTLLTLHDLWLMRHHWHKMEGEEGKEHQQQDCRQKYRGKLAIQDYNIFEQTQFNLTEEL